MTTTLRHYHDRMRRVLAHVDRHLADDLDLDTVSGVAAFSKFHLHRRFTATFGVSLHRYVQLARMKRASYRLAHRGAASVTTIAMDAGDDAPDAFACAFRRRLGQSPSGFRHAPDRESWRAALRPFDHARNRIMSTDFTADAVTIRDVPPTPVAILTHHGPATIGATIRRFIAWRKATGLIPPTSATFNIFHTDPQATAPADQRIDLCVTTDRPIEPSGEAIVAGTIPGGRCAVLRVVGHTDDLEPAARYLYREWLPASGEEARDFPLYCQRISLFPDVAEHEAVADLFLPLR